MLYIDLIFAQQFSLQSQGFMKNIELVVLGISCPFYYLKIRFRDVKFAFRLSWSPRFLPAQIKAGRGVNFSGNVLSTLVR